MKGYSTSLHIKLAPLKETENRIFQSKGGKKNFQLSISDLKETEMFILK